MDKKEETSGTDEMDMEVNAEDKNVLANLAQCRESCLEGVMHCLDEGGDFVKKEHIRWLLDCTEICTAAENFVIKGSEYAGDLLGICAFVCDDCAESCETFFNDEHMKNCALVCRNCAAACRDSIEEEEFEETANEKEDNE